MQIFNNENIDKAKQELNKTKQEFQKIKNVRNINDLKTLSLKRIVIALAIIIVFLLIVFRLLKSEKQDVVSTPVVRVTHIETGDINKEASVMGTIMPASTYYVVNKVAGEITNIYVENGQRVKKGDKICDIDNSKQIESAFIQYDTVKKSYERYQKLYNAGDISKQSYEQAKAQYDAAKLAYDTQVEYSTPVAVGDGIIENTDMTLNVSISTGKVLCYITSEDAKEIQFGVTERVLNGIKQYDTIKVEKQGKIYEGTITDKASLISQNTGLFNIKATIEDDNNFAAGVMAKVTFVYEKSEDTNILDIDLIYYDDGRPFVYVVENNTLTKKFVELGISTDEKVEILSGVDKDDNIVSTWNNSLAEGVHVEVLKDSEG